MRGFDESWLRDYRLRQAMHPAPELHPPRQYSFNLKAPLLLPNRKKSLHWAVQSQLIHALSQEVAQAIKQDVSEPMKRAHIRVWRHGIREPDPDNLEASLKWLLDVLQPRSQRHPYGLGIIAGDDSEHCAYEIFHVQTKTRVEQKTKVHIREFGP